MDVSVTRNAGKTKRYPAIENFPRVLVTGNKCTGNRNYYVIRDFILFKYVIISHIYPNRHTISVPTTEAPGTQTTTTWSPRVLQASISHNYSPP